MNHPRSNVIIDGNNVMGARADGWWRNRAEAARRLTHQAAQLARNSDASWTIVFDGPPHDDRPPPTGITVVWTNSRKRDSADDYIVEWISSLPANQANSFTVYTADRELKRRLASLGARTAAPQQLLGRISALPHPSPAQHRPRHP